MKWIKSRNSDFLSFNNQKVLHNERESIIIIISTYIRAYCAR